MNPGPSLRVTWCVFLPHFCGSAMLGAVMVALTAAVQAQTVPQGRGTDKPNAVHQDAGETLPDSPGVLSSSSQEQTHTGKQDAAKDTNAGQTTTAAPDSIAEEQKKQFESTGNEPVQTPRILGIMPNFQSVTADQKLPPETVRQKFMIAGKSSFDYSSFLLAGVQAGFAQNANSYPEFRQGAIGYFRYYWHTLADTADENFMVAGAGTALFHEDSRFYTLGHGTFLHRAEYASTRIFVTRNDHGNETVNLAEIVGAGAAAGVSSLYYPTRYQTWTKVGQKWLTSALIDSANYTFKEFWPSINRKLFHER